MPRVKEIADEHDLPIMPEVELARIQASSPDDALRAGFGALLTERGSLPLESMDVAARIDGLLSRITVVRFSSTRSTNRSRPLTSFRCPTVLLLQGFAWKWRGE